jgi:hypothetical protein
MSKSAIEIEYEYLKLKAGDFSNWYSKLNKTEKLRFNSVLALMRNRFYKSKSNDTKKS